MLERAVLDVLARAAEIGLPEHALMLAAVYDPFLRPAIRRRVRAAIRAASEKTSRGGEHVLRLAFLLAHSPPPEIKDPNDERAIAQAFDRLAAPFVPPRPAPPPGAVGAYRGAPVQATLDADAPPKKTKHRWPFTTAFGATLATAALGVTAFIALPYWTPTPYEHFQGTPFGKALGVPLTNLIGGGDEARVQARRELEAPAVKKQIGEPASDAVARVVATQLEVTNSKEPDINLAMAPLGAAINDADRTFAAAHVPALLHAWGRNGGYDSRAVWVTSYFVEERATPTLDGRAFPVAWGRRLDRLNLEDSAVFKSANEDHVIVSLPLMEEELVQIFLQPLAHGKPMTEQSPGTPGFEFSRAVAPLITHEITDALAISPADAATLADAIARRNLQLEALARERWRTTASSQIWLSPWTLRLLQSAQEENEYDARTAREVLRLDDHMKVYAGPVLPLLHEIALVEEERFLGFLVEEGSVPRELADIGASAHLAAHLAGELASLARTRKTPRVALWLALEPLVHDRRQYLDERVNLHVLRKLFAHLGVDPGPGSFYEDAFLRAVTTVFSLPAHRVRDAASRTYAEIFGHPVPVLVR